MAQVAEAEPGEVGEREGEGYQGYCEQKGRDEGAGQGAGKGAQQDAAALGGAGEIVGGGGRVFGLGDGVGDDVFMESDGCEGLPGFMGGVAIGQLCAFSEVDSELGLGCHGCEVYRLGSEIL